MEARRAARGLCQGLRQALGAVSQSNTKENAHPNQGVTAMPNYLTFISAFIVIQVNENKSGKDSSSVRFFLVLEIAMFALFHHAVLALHVTRKYYMLTLLTTYGFIIICSLVF